jgi:branched-chain amino acid transport system substrate-binding protein
MKQSMRKLMMTGAAVVGLGLLTARAEAQEIKVGVISAVTGTFSFVGVPLANAVKVAADELNAQNYFGNLKVTVIYEDNASDKDQAIALINRMVKQDNVIAVIGPISTGEAMATAPVAVDLKVPMFTTATSPDVLKAGPWIFKAPENAEVYMSVLGNYISGTVKPKSCFLVSIRDNAGYLQQKDIFRDSIKAAGIKIASDELILAADTDFTALSTKIADSGADCLFLSTPPEQGANITIQARQGGMPANTVLIGNTGMASPNYVKAGGKAVEGTYLPAEFVPTGVNDLAKTFIADYTKRFGTAPDNFAAEAHTMFRIIAAAIKSTGPGATREQIRDAIAKTKDFPTVLGNGSYTLDADRIPHYGIQVLKLVNGQWTKP